MKSSAWVLCVLAVLGAVRPVRAQMIEDYRAKGTVVDTEGTPIAGVKITLRDPTSGRRLQFDSGKDGKFDRRMIPHAIYELVAEKPGYVAHREKLDWHESTADTIVKEFTIVLSSEAARQKQEMDRAKSELGKKIGKTYQEAYEALNRKDCVTAESKAREILAVGAGSLEHAVHFVIARCLGTTGKLDESIAEYRKVIELKDDLFEAHFDLAGVLEQQGMHDEAISEYERAGQLKPNDPDVPFNTGAILFRGGKFDAAKPHLEAAIAANPKNSQAVKALGYANLSAEKKDMAEAQRLLALYLELEPSAPDAEQVRQILKELSAKK